MFYPDIVEAAFGQKRFIEYTAKCDTFTVFGGEMHCIICRNMIYHNMFINTFMGKIIFRVTNIWKHDKIVVDYVQWLHGKIKRE